MILHQFYLGCLSHASYLIADEDSGEALIVDPQRDIDTYVDFLDEHGLHPIAVALTHLHADFVAGHIELRDRYAIPILVGAGAPVDFDHRPLHDGEVVPVGRVRVEALATPGHTPEGISFVVRERDGAAPHAVLTGDTLFVGDVGRPDLLASVGVTAEELAGQLYDSLHGKLLKLPDATLVYPAHGAESLCGRALSQETVSTIGEQRRSNPALLVADRADFVRELIADQLDAPRYFLHDALTNRHDRPAMDAVVARCTRRLSTEQVRAAVLAHGQVIDVRDADSVHRAHLKGSLNVGLHGRYATWAGSLLDPGRPLAVIGPRDELRESVTRLARIGYDRVAGVIAWEDLEKELRDEEVASTRRIAPDELQAFLRDTGDLGILDVRAPGEHSEAAFPGAINVPLGELADRAAELDRKRPWLVHCAGGYRSSAAVTLLQGLGFARIYDLEGGFAPHLAADLGPAETAR